MVLLCFILTFKSMKKLFITLGALLASYFVFCQNYPFPQSLNYQFGIKATNAQVDKIQSHYQSWVTNFYVESGNMARIKFDDGQYTVSEGIGYGMLIYVYMDNQTNQTQSKFDKLYNYYSNFSRYQSGSRKYLMDWKIQGFTSVNGSGAATDGDLDVALALLIAHKQWGSSGSINYIHEAEILLTFIYDKLVDGNKLLKPGDNWNSEKNPCYFTTAAIGLFDRVQTLENFTQTRDWAGVYTQSQVYLKNSQATSGLWPDWTSPDLNATPSSGNRGNYYWDACRTPWRVAWDYLWYGTSDAQTMCAKSVQFLSNKGLLSNPAGINSGYTMAGNTYNSDGSGNACFVGGFAAAMMTNSSNQSNLDTYYNTIVNNRETYGYYAPTLQILYLLTLSGNTPNFYSLDVSNTPPRFASAQNSLLNGSEIIIEFSQDLATVSSSQSQYFTVKINGVVASISSLSFSSSTPRRIVIQIGSTVSPGDAITISYSGGSIKNSNGDSLEAFSEMAVTNNLVSNESFLIADCENESLTSLGTNWYSFDDNGDGGASSVSPLSSDSNPFTMTSGGANGTVNAAKIDYTINNGSLGYEGYVGLGFYFNSDETPYNLSEATGFSFWHKGEACFFEVELSTISDDCNYKFNVPSHSSWTLVEVQFNQLAQYDGWGVDVDWNPSLITKVQWKVQKGNVNQTENVWIDEVRALGIGSIGMADKTELHQLIRDAENFLSQITIGDEPGSFSQQLYDNLALAINSAKIIDNSVNASQNDVENEKLNLELQLAQFAVSGLIDLITEANSLVNVNIGTSAGQFPQSASNDLEIAIAIATNTTNSSNYVEQIDAILNLSDAIEEFLDSKIIDNGTGTESNILVSVGPNPARNFLFVNGVPSSPIEIVNVGGLIVLTTNSSIIDISGLTSGFYFIKIEKNELIPIFIEKK